MWKANKELCAVLNQQADREFLYHTATVERQTHSFVFVIFLNPDEPSCLVARSAREAVELAETELEEIEDEDLSPKFSILIYKRTRMVKGLELVAPPSVPDIGFSRDDVWFLDVKDKVLEC